MKKNNSFKLKSKKFVKLLFAIAVVLIFVQFGYLTYQNKDKFFSGGYEKQYVNLKNAYYSSQYAKKNATAIIPDETFEAFAAGAFLKGMNPIHIVHDHPPLGRYILSLSIILFDNPATIILLLMSISFLGIYLISRIVIKNIFLSLVPIAIFANEPLMLGKLLYAPLPEPIQLPFIIFSIYFFIKAIRAGRRARIYLFCLVAILLGFVISIRFFVTGGVLFIAMLSYLAIFRRNMYDLLSFCVTLTLSIVVLLLSYTRTILDGYSILQIFGVQKYILAYHKSAFVHTFSFWDLILFNRWHTWWGEQKISFDPQWIVVWPISTVVSIVTGILYLFRKVKLSDAEIILFLWVSGYCLMLSTGYTSTRYFLPILPFIYILFVTGVIKIVNLLRHDKKN